MAKKKVIKMRELQPRVTEATGSENAIAIFDREFKEVDKGKLSQVFSQLLDDMMDGGAYAMIEAARKIDRMPEKERHAMTVSLLGLAVKEAIQLQEKNRDIKGYI